jgi:hypothetical protein
MLLVARQDATNSHDVTALDATRPQRKCPGAKAGLDRCPEEVIRGGETVTGGNTGVPSVGRRA